MSANGNSHKQNGNIITLPNNKIQSSQIQQPPQQTSSSSSSSSSSQHHQQQQHQPQQHQPQGIQSHSSSSSSAAVQQQISSGHHHLNNNQSNSGVILSAHTIPPRYQPPPQPPGGILKHISSSKSGYFPAELSGPHLSIKYPPDIPKLASVYIPDSVKSSGNPSRFAQRPPPHRNSAGHIPVPVLVQQSQSHHNDEHLIRQQQQQQQHQQQQQLQQQQQQQQDMLKFVRKPDPEQPVTTGGSAAPGPGRLTVEQNRHLQSLLSELRALKEANQRLNDDNQELRDLCCFLDDDRQKGRKLAREWQRFGRYTASVMRQEVSAYQNKLRQLDDKQQELIRDNLELKELCLYLDEERAHVAANTLCVNCGATTRPALRDDGDGSSSSTNADETISAIRQFERQIPELNLRSTLSDQTLQYVRSLERKIRQLEEERSAGTANIQQSADPISGRPEAVVRALQVLEVREQLERDRVGNTTTTPEQMDDGEKALVREMCNVVWRKLEETPNGPNLDPL